MHSPSLFVFEDVLQKSFGLAVEELLGCGVENEIYRILESKGIRKEEIPSRFDKVIEVLLQVLGECSRVIIHRVLRVLYEKYSLPIDFSFQETLVDRLNMLRDRIVVDHLRPRGLGEADLYPDANEKTSDEDSAANNQKAGWSGSYRYKKGLGSGSSRD
ncbi:MAG TPA: hypothetical protein VFE96_01295 [Candidatus Bathyarchaeia archaeon]|nr:hypothetical protein [Candidatus Bathyarchaeia archaeon]